MIWLLGLVAFAAMLVLVLFLSFAGQGLFSACQDQPACENGNTTCCQQTGGAWGDTGSARTFLNWMGLGPTDRVAESQLYAFIPENLICEDSQQFEVSGFIRFGWRGGELQDKEIKKIHGFMSSPEQIEKLWIFGFASPDGENDHNAWLAERRACAVRQHIPENYRGQVSIMPIGEDNPINGIANSRSAVIAACRTAPGAVGTSGKPDTAKPQCPASGCKQTSAEGVER